MKKVLFLTVGFLAAAIWGYEPGSGSGLRKLVLWPSMVGSVNPNDECNVEATANCAVGLAAVEGGELAAGVCDKARVVWTGRLIVPEAGQYAFSLVTKSGGGMVRVGGVQLINMHAEAGITNTSEAVTLAAGETDIRVEYLAVTGDKECKLYWEGPMEKEEIPATQLIDGGETDAAVDGWKVRSCITGNTGIQMKYRNFGVFEKTGAGQYAIETPVHGTSALPDWMNMTVASRKLKGICFAEAQVKRLKEEGSAGLVMQNDAGYFAMWQFCRKLKEEVGEDGNKVKVTRSWFEFTLEDKNGYPAAVYQEVLPKLADEAKVRVERRGRKVTFIGEAAGQECRYEWTAPEGMFGRETWMGLMGQGNGGWPFKPSRWQFDGVKAVEVKGIVVLVR